MATGFNLAQNMMKRMFDEIDTDGNGTLDKDEFSELLDRQGYKLSWKEFEVCLYVIVIRPPPPP